MSLRGLWCIIQFPEIYYRKTRLVKTRLTAVAPFTIPINARMGNGCLCTRNHLKFLGLPLLICTCMNCRGCLEPKFFATFLTIFLKSLPSDFTGPIGTPPPRVEQQLDVSTWENMQKYFAAGFLTRTRDDWGAIFHG